MEHPLGREGGRVREGGPGGADADRQTLSTTAAAAAATTRGRRG